MFHSESSWSLVGDNMLLHHMGFFWFRWSSVNYMGRGVLENLALNMGESLWVIEAFFFWPSTQTQNAASLLSLQYLFYMCVYINIWIPYCTQIWEIVCLYESFCREEKDCLCYFCLVFSPMVSNCHFCRTPLFLIQQF